MKLHKTRSLFSVVFSTQIIFRIYLNWPFTESISTPDSVTYRPSSPGPQTFPYEGATPLEKLSEVSFVGNSIRPWTINLIYKILQNDFFIILAQNLFSAFAWTYLAYTLFKILENKFQKIAAIFVVLGFSLTDFIYSWDKFILSESLINSFFILLFSLILNANNNNYRRQILIYLLSLYIFISRPLFGIFILAYVIILLLNKKYKIIKLLIFLLSILYVLNLNLNISETWKSYLGTTRDGMSFSYILNYDNLHGKQFIDYIKTKNAPNCLTSFQNTPWVTARSYESNCPEGLKWLSQNFISVYVQYLSSPANFFTYSKDLFQGAFTGLDLRNYYPFYEFKKLFFTSFFTFLFWNLDILIITFYFILYTLFIFLSDKNRVSIILITFYPTVYLASLAQLFFMPDEFGRLALPGSIFLNLIPWIYLLILSNKLLLKYKTK